MAGNKIFIFGLDRAGKTTSVQYLVSGEAQRNHRPTISFITSNLTVKKVKLQLWDGPGQKKFRSMWGKGVNNADVLVFFLDTADKERWEESKKEFKNVLDNLDNRTLPVIFCFNKMDLDEAKANLAEAKEFFNIENILVRKVYPLETTIEDLHSIDMIGATMQKIIFENSQSE
jgi:ADP-ribosylation factor-like protein 8